MKQKESVNDVVINPDLSSEQQDEVKRDILRCAKSDKPNRTQG